jgi:hypothetical protein
MGSDAGMTTPPSRPDEPEEPIVEPENSTVDDWFGQDVERDRVRAEDALREAGGDEERAEEIFEEEREPHRADRYNVPADERPA